MLTLGYVLGYVAEQRCGRRTESNPLAREESGAASSGTRARGERRLNIFSGAQPSRTGRDGLGPGTWAVVEAIGRVGCAAYTECWHTDGSPRTVVND